MPTSKRAKQLAREKYERQQTRRDQRRAKQKRNALIASAGTIGLIIAVVAAFMFWPDSETTAAPEPSESTSESAPPAPVPTPSGVTCTDAAGTKQTQTFKKPAQMKLTAGATMALATNCGEVAISLDVLGAPATTNAVAFLAGEGFYNNNQCHRLTVDGIFVVQCGSPNLDGTGDIGFHLSEENFPKTDGDSKIAIYTTGTVAMANAGKDSTQSQFFLVYKDSPLPPNYSILGQITSGLDVVQYVAAQGVEPGSPDLRDGPPAQNFVINTATVRNG